VASKRRADGKVAGPSIETAVDAFLGTLDNSGTARNYAGTLRALVAQLRADTPLALLASPVAGAEVCSWFERRWGERAAATWNRNLDALRSACRYWANQGWLDADPAQGLRRRKRPPDRTRALSRAEVEALLSRGDVALRDKTLWRMLYETAARISEVLSLDVSDLNLRTHQARVRRKGGAADVIVWQTGTARLLPRLLQGRKGGPVFLTGRRARVTLPATDLEPVSGQARLSYRRAAEVFEEATGGWTLHQLRHSALTHAAEDGANTSTLLAYSGHTSVSSLTRYTRISPEALARWQESRDPARRRR
jgi:integrase